MNEQTLLKLIGNIDVKYIAEAEDIRRFKAASLKRRRKKIVSVAALFLIFVFAVSPLMRNSGSDGMDNVKEVSSDNGASAGVSCVNVELYMNSAQYTVLNDMDVRIISPTPLNKSFLADRKADSLDEHYNLLSASVPEGFFYNGMCIVEAPVMKGMVKRYEPHDRIYEFYDGEKVLEIKVCDFEKPLSDCIVISSEEILSEIGTEEVLIKNFNNSYYAEFEKDGVYYDITSHNLTSDELTGFLINLIMPGGMNE